MMKKTAMAPGRWWNWLYSNYAREVTASIAAIVLLLAVATFLNDRANARQDHVLTEQTAQRTEDNLDNARVNCENANESRQASRTLWYFAIDLASKSASPADAAYLAQVRSWIGDVYQPHDCNDLARQYPLPPPPIRPAAVTQP